MDGQFRSTWDLIGISDACLKIFKILHYGFTMLSLDLTLSHTCISYVSAKFPGKDLLVQCIFLSTRYFKGFRELLKKVVTFDAAKNLSEIRDPKTMNKWHQKLHEGLFTRLLTGLFILLWRSFTDFSLSLFHLIPLFSLIGNAVSMR